MVMYCLPSMLASASELPCAISVWSETWEGKGRASPTADTRDARSRPIWSCGAHLDQVGEMDGTSEAKHLIYGVARKRASETACFCEPQREEQREEQRDEQHSVASFSSLSP